MLVGWDSVVTITNCRGLMVQGSNPGGGKILCTFSDQSWGPPSLLYNEYWVSLPEVKQLRHDVEHPPPHPPSSPEVKKTVELYIYSHYEPL